MTAKPSQPIEADIKSLWCWMKKNNYTCVYSIAFAVLTLLWWLFL